MLEELQTDENFGIDVFLDTALSENANKYATLIKMCVWNFRNFTV